MIYKGREVDLSQMGERLKMVMYSRGVSTTNLAKKLGVSRQYVNYLKAGERSFSIEIALQICGELDINIEWFITGIGKIDN